MGMNRWAERAKQLASWSKDPTTKVGCVLVRNGHTVAEGFNGYPHGANDAAVVSRVVKRLRTVHAEANAVAHAARLGVSAAGTHAYITHPPCANCAGLLIQAGVEAVWVVPDEDSCLHPDWAVTASVAQELFREVGMPYNVLKDGC